MKKTAKTKGETSEKPNFIIFMTDQQRSIQHFGTTFVPQNLPNYQWFLDNGVVFENHQINTSPCGPSRASLFSGLYPATNGVTQNEQTLDPGMMNFAQLLSQEAGYNIIYKGKFHMDALFTEFSQNWKSDPNATNTANDEDQDIAEKYFLNGWTSPDFGTALVEADPTENEIGTLAGGSGNNDDRVVNGVGFIGDGQQSVIQYIQSLADNPPAQPFCLVVSLLNPHDVSLYPYGYADAGYDLNSFQNISDIQTPDTYSDPLTSKPQVQGAFVNNFNNGDSKQKLGDNDALLYSRFYAYLHTLSDGLLEQVRLAWLNVSETLQNNTYLIRMADHGEMGMAHGGMQEKTFNMYDETVKVPMIWYHPTLIQKGLRNNSISLIDFVPTIATLAGADINVANPPLQGTSYADALLSDNAVVSEPTLFSYVPRQQTDSPPDETRQTPASVGLSLYPNPLLPAGKGPSYYPNFIYGITTTDRYKYAVYFNFNQGVVDWSRAQFELYAPFSNGELDNQIAPGTVPDAATQLLWRQLHAALTNLLVSKGVPLPDGWNQPLAASGNNAAWVQYTTDQLIYVDNNLNGNNFQFQPNILTSLSSYTDGLYTTGAGILYGFDNMEFRSYVHNEKPGITISPASAAENQWSMSWLAQTGVNGGLTPKGATNWVQYSKASDIIYVDIDTSSFGFTETPMYFVSLLGTSNVLYTRGANIAYGPTATGFRIYVQYKNGPITPAQANAWNWSASWLAVEAGAPNSGTIPATDWQQYTRWGNNQLYADVQFSGLQNTPLVFSALTCTSNGLYTTGAGIIYHPTADGFRCYLNYDNGAVSPQVAQDGQWTLNWIAIPQ